MTARLVPVLIVLAFAASSLTACGTEADLADSQEAAKVKESAKLNLSHIECGEGIVRAHFVLLFAGSANPGNLTVTLNGAQLPAVGPEKNTGNVWHYWITFPTGVIESVDASVGATQLHNGAEFIGDWSCDGGACVLDEELAGSFCPGGPLTNPTEECAYFGLANVAKDATGFSGTTASATTSAPLALVKAANCYNVFVNVSSGDALASPPNAGPQGQTQDISHITYCDCPASEQ